MNKSCVLTYKYKAFFEIKYPGTQFFNLPGLKARATLIKLNRPEGQGNLNQTQSYPPPYKSSYLPIPAAVLFQVPQVQDPHQTGWLAGPVL